ncbi:MAG: FHA domain-containing protein [Vicinamibacteraceae bacterium]|nr:FHA domain-containing protein [Vicinamibacteraceae bacterium]
MWILHSPATPEAGAFTFRVSPGAIKTIGRAIRADFIVDAALVSRFHCRLSAARDGRLKVEDLGSTNGTFVNDRRVQHAALVPGDRLRVGRVELVVSHSTSPEAEPESIDEYDDVDELTAD